MDGTTGGQWDTAHQDLTDISVRSPETLFTLEYYGSSFRDHGVRYYRNGSCQAAGAEIPPYSPSLPEFCDTADEMVAAGTFRIVDIPEEAGHLPWLKEQAVQQNQGERNNEFLVVTGNPPRQVTSTGDTCRARMTDGSKCGQDALAYVYEYGLPELEGANGYAGYCPGCLAETYGMEIRQMQDILGQS